MEYQTITDLIDSGDEKFKLGLAWYVIYDMIDSSDYHYIDLLKLPTDDIKRILDERYTKLLLNGRSKDTYSIEGRAYDRMMLIVKKRRTEPLIDEKYNSISSIIGDYMYRLLVNPDKYFRSSKPSELADLIGHSANRVIRNYHQGGILKYNQSLLTGEECMNYIANYHKSKGFKCTTGW